MRKYCPRCKTTKNKSEFNINKGKRNGLKAYCRPCQRLYERDYYAANISRRKKIRQTAKIRIKLAREFIIEYLLNHPCVDCGEKNPVVLDFDHIKGKKFSISSMVYRGVSITELAIEMAKCEIRCANCHRIKTTKEGKYWGMDYL